ncbi:sugar ABC transporter permease [Agromyces intestinalis]|uniref:Sugar ABC transporter permease n=2 Tax=Agromyces TaxID=33877 RepID=A0A5C1YHF9_9MICO|nr:MULTISPECIES: sugar ABC transporter permease [Agromyces]QEO15411.1 sugar ABC transporter permease [Agromyces intestinalis]UOE45762.1 sugar ABC transporter permease [Agromyces larvae]
MSSTLVEHEAAAKAPRPVTTGTPSPRRSRRLSWGRITPYLLILPAIVFELLVHVVPMVVGVWMSFIQLTQFYITNWLSAPFVGFGNFQIALDFQNPLGAQLARSFGVTLAFTILTVGSSWLFGMAASIVLQRSFRGRGFLRTLFLIPYAIPAYAGIITWKFIFQRDTGLLNELLVDNLHLTDTAPFWLIGDNAFWSLVIVSVWQQWPFAFLMTMAGMQGIPEELYEAAAIDGASVWQQMRHITLGLMRPINSVLLLLLFLWTFREFNTPFVLFGARPADSANLLVVNIYQSSFIQWNFGLGAAMSVLLMLFLILVAALWAVWNRKVRRDA